MTRGHVFFANLSETNNTHIQGGYRPWLVVQNNAGNKYSPTTIVVPLTSNIKKHPNQPTHCFVIVHGLRPSIALCEQIRVIDVKPFYKPILKLPDCEMKKVDKCLKYTLGLEVL